VFLSSPLSHTSQDLKKQTAMRLMAQQQQEDGVVCGYDPQGREIRPKQHQSPHRGVAPTPPVHQMSVLPSTQRSQPANNGGRYRGNNRKVNNRRSDGETGKDDGSSSASAGSSVYSGHTPNRRGGGGQGGRNGGSNNRDQQRKLPHGLTVQELKDLTAARLARESVAPPEMSSKAGSKLCQPNQQQRGKVTAGRSTLRKPMMSPHHEASPYRQLGSSTPNRNESPVSLPTFQGHAPAFGAGHQNILHPVPQSRFEQSPRPLTGHFQPMMSPRMMESPSRPEEVVHLRSRHCSIDSVSTLGSEYLASADPKSPFQAPFRGNSFGMGAGGNDGLARNFSTGNMCNGPQPPGHMQDALGRALSQDRERALSQDQGSFDHQQGMRVNKPGYDILMSPNSAFSERSESRNQYLNSPFWAVDEDRPSTGDHVVPLFNNRDAPRSSGRDEPRSGFEGYHQDSVSLNGLEGFRQHGTDRQQPQYMESLSMPDNMYDDRDFLPAVPQPMPRQQSESDVIPNWVAESVLVTPLASDGRKTMFGKSASGSAAWPESANKAADIFRPTQENHEGSRVHTASTWTCSSPGSTSGVGVIGNRPPPSTSLSFGGVDILAEELGSILNLKPERNVSLGLSDSIFHRSDDAMFAPLEQASSSMEGHVSLSENEAALSNAASAVESGSKGSLWGWSLGRTKEHFQE
jgi:hypothetical protein